MKIYEKMIKKEREKTKKERFLSFEHELMVLTNEVINNKDDLYLVNDLKQAIIIFAMKDMVDENDNVFLNNVKNDFYEALNKIEEIYGKLQTFKIRLFMEDYYLNNIERKK